MRIAQVSAHYPPNFVSGGTLVPQRVARYVKGAGHESLVYAGYLDKDRRPLETWTETDEEGVEVTWLVTTPWTAWTDPHNYDNPGATAAFSRWLERTAPDIVHVHSLQTLGVGLVEAAHAAGAKVVVTMHDFWWFCSRQFLVDQSMRPCSLVTECGACDCDAAPSIAGRSERLLRALTDADLVLAPSRSAARVLAANGVEPRVLRVNENGLLDAQLARLGPEPVARTGTGPVRLMYAGGMQEMKGVEVLGQAARLIGEREGLVLDAYGVEARVDASTPSWFRARPAFDPAELLSVLDSHDVLVLPSIMRESHSILTREALAAGLAVVCTDTLGPEEAVTDGVNGYIVPAGEPRALAERLTHLADDPAGARDLTGRGSSSPIRSFSEQGAELLEYYAGLVEAQDDELEAVRRAQAQLLDKVLFIIGIDGAPLRYRAHLPAEALRMRGHEVVVRHYRDPALLGDVEDADAVVLYRVPATVQVLDLIERFRTCGREVPVLYDVDDLIFDSSLRGTLDGLEKLSEAEEELWWHGVDRYRTTLEACDGFVGSTDMLCQEATRLTGLPSYRYANGVGTLLAQASDRVLLEEGAREDSTVTIGYFSGTTTHDADWAMVEPALAAVMRRHPEVRLRLGGHLEPTGALSEFAPRISRSGFVPWYRLPELLRATDICLAPLTGDSVFNESKSAIKWLEAALVSRPTVATPTGPFREVIEHGRTGMLASTTQEWEEAIEELVTSVALRTSIGAAARREALLELSPRTQGRVYEDILVDAALHLRRNGHRTDSTWEPVADDEPFSAADAPVDPYTVPLRPGVVLPRGLARARRLGRRTLVVARSEGLGSVARRTARKVSRRMRR